MLPLQGQPFVSLRMLFPVWITGVYKKPPERWRQWENTVKQPTLPLFLPVKLPLYSILIPEFRGGIALCCGKHGEWECIAKLNHLKLSLLPAAQEGIHLASTLQNGILILMYSNGYRFLNQQIWISSWWGRIYAQYPNQLRNSTSWSTCTDVQVPCLIWAHV